MPNISVNPDINYKGDRQFPKYDWRKSGLIASRHNNPASALREKLRKGNAFPLTYRMLEIVVKIIWNELTEIEMIILKRPLKNFNF